MKQGGRSGVAGWITQWGFAVLVGIAALAAGYVAWKVSVPKQVPDFALNAEAIYRIEVGAAAFLAFYLVEMAFVLALNNRGFSEIGVNGLKAQDMANRAQQDAIQEHEESLEILWTVVNALEDSTEASVQDLKSHLKALEKSSAEKASGS